MSNPAEKPTFGAIIKDFYQVHSKLILLESQIIVLYYVFVGGFQGVAMRLLR